MTQQNAGLAPDAAGDWLRLHRAFALRPEQIASRLEAGATPKEILEQAIEERDEPAVATRSDLGRRAWERDRSRLVALGARVVPRGLSGYPPALAALVDAPSVLLVRGQADCLASTGVAIVGARAATHSARATAHRIARDLAARGITIVSGLARGIDAAAHRGALEVGGCTIAVLACGLDRVYPPEHRGLALEIEGRGAVISELPLGAPPRRAHFPLRNRLISGLSVGVVVVEARRRSGSLITVRHALNQGREVLVVPGAIDGPFAEGTNLLLRDGARPVLSAEDVIEDLGLEVEAADDGSCEPAGRDVSTLEAEDPSALKILAVLEHGPLDREELARRSKLESGALARALLELELANRVVFDRDGRFQRNWR